MRTLIEHVVSFGHRRIGLVAGQPGLATTRERVEAFRAALAANGLAARRRQYCGRSNVTTRMRRAATRAASRWRDPPTAVITGNNLDHIGAMQAMRERGL